ncbi:hypothetical protein O181_000664 [Austropuccinia psidii MF-1]|uniref:Uncharacterized protein n=1 Tax=Austropuccinia psidii MF-1 TaxID=1389203 RepID=A0A9Q3B908_9BASI|nr:hypothetical protein [Austropuccinia psidii MF-1]
MAHKLRDPLQPGDFVFFYKKTLESQWGLLFKNHWKGPLRVISQVNNGPYELEELDGTKDTRKFAENHVKIFYPREQIVYINSELENESSEESEVEDSTLEEEEIENNAEYDLYQ